MRRTTITRRTSDAAAATVRAGDTILGSLGNLHTEDDGTMRASFAHAPAFADHAQHLAERAARNGTPEAGRIAQDIEAAGIHVWHGVHDMRIDVAGTLVVAKGEVRFRPTDAFNTLRSGGLG